MNKPLIGKGIRIKGKSLTNEQIGATKPTSHQISRRLARTNFEYNSRLPSTHSFHQSYLMTMNMPTDVTRNPKGKPSKSLRTFNKKDSSAYCSEFDINGAAEEGKARKISIKRKKFIHQSILQNQYNTETTPN